MNYAAVVVLLACPATRRECKSAATATVVRLAHQTASCAGLVKIVFQCLTRFSTRPDKNLTRSAVWIPLNPRRPVSYVREVPSAISGFLSETNLLSPWRITTPLNPQNRRSRRIHFALQRLHKAPPPGMDSAEMPRAGRGLLPRRADPAAAGHQHPELPRDRGPGCSADGPGVRGGHGVGRAGARARVECVRAFIWCATKCRSGVIDVGFASLLVPLP